MFNLTVVRIALPLAAALLVMVLAHAGATAQPPAPVVPPARVDSAALHSVRVENARLVARVDSLREELRQHRYAENFLDSALDEQANRFSLIIAGLLAILGTVTWAGFRQEVRRLEKELRTTLSEQETRSRDAEARLVAMEAFTRRMAGNTYSALARLNRSQKQFARAVVSNLLGGANFFAASRLIPENPTASRSRRKAALSNLRNARTTLLAIDAAGKAAAGKHFHSESARLEEAFDLLRQNADAEGEQIVAEIRVLLQSCLDAYSAAGRGG